MANLTDGGPPFHGAANDGPAPRESWWACEEGEWQHFSTRSPHNFNRLDPNDSYSGRVFFFQRLRMVRRSVEGGRLTFKWRVADVSPGALAAMLGFLDYQAPRGRPVRLVFNFGGWHREEAASPGAAIDRVLAVQTLRGVSPALSTQLQQHGLERLEESPVILRDGLRAWRQSAGYLEARAAALLLSRSLIFGVREDCGDLVFQHVGPLSLFAQTYGRQWRDLVRGRRADEGMPGQQADERRLAEVYWDVLREEAPRLEHARVPIREATGETTWRTYHRLLLPLRSTNGARQLLCLCAETPRVDLPTVFSPNALSAG